MGFSDKIKITAEKDIVLNKPMKLAVFILFILIGLVISYFTYSLLINSFESKNWPKKEGVILSSEFVSSIDSDKKPIYTAEILYEYYIENIKYVGNSVTVGGLTYTSNPNYAQLLINKYQKNTKVEVFYNPKNPEQAVLEPGFNWLASLPFLIGIIFSFVGLIGAIVMIKKFKQ